MSSRKALVLIVLALILIGLPVLFDRRLAAKYSRHDELVSKYECYPFPCSADFNGNGSSDQLGLANLNGGISGRLTIIDGAREIFSLPYTGVDNTFRTHAAIYKSTQSSVPHLLIFDGSQKPRIESVFAWDGEKMREIESSGLEREIISAMAARDDTGGWNEWVLWRVTSTLGLPLYCILVGGLLIVYGRAWIGKK